jgi:hypothetical protein
MIHEYGVYAIMNTYRMVSCAVAIMGEPCSIDYEGFFNVGRLIAQLKWF